MFTVSAAERPVLLRNDHLRTHAFIDFMHGKSVSQVHSERDQVFIQSSTSKDHLLQRTEISDGQRQIS